MSEKLRARVPEAGAARRSLAVLGACAAVLCCSASEGEEPGTADSKTAAARPDVNDPVAYWMSVWGKTHPLDPMYLRLPVGVDTRGWDLMHEGFIDSLGNQKGFNRPARDNYERDYDFSWDVFTLNIPLWRTLLEPFAGKPNVRYLEIGVAEGRSLLWVLDNILTHPTSRATGIDPFMVAGHEARLRANIEKSSGPEKTRLIKGFSQDVLPDLEPDSYDIIYIDGSHLAGDVMFDSVYTWRLLRDGGLVIHDDYNAGTKPAETQALIAIDMFITGRRNTAQVLHRGHQVVLRKLPLDLPEFCWNRDPCLRIGNYLYAWNSDRLLEVGTEKLTPLSESEQTVVKGILRSRRIGAEAELVLEQDIAALRSQFPKEFARLATLLDLRVSSPPAPRDAR
jgi:predicted O-methyltransferase YrrM